jgi:hypothetical protein
MISFSREYLVEEYVNKGRSTHDIAKDHKYCYPNLVRRSLIRFGIELRDRSEAQKSSKVRHLPTAGKERSEADCKKISDGVTNNWNKRRSA